MSDLAQRAAIQYSLHHTRNPLHQLAALVTMLRDALPPSARNLSRVKWAFHELHSSLRTMTAVVDYTLVSVPRGRTQPAAADCSHCHHRRRRTLSHS